MNKLQFNSALIDKITTLKDGSLKIVLITQELSAEEEFALFSLRKEANTIQLVEPVLEKGQKSKSQRLRAVLYRYWEQNYQGSHANSDNFYNEIMEKIINQYKDKLS